MIVIERFFRHRDLTGEHVLWPSATVSKGDDKSLNPSSTLSAYWALFERRKHTIVENRFLASLNKSLPHAQSCHEKKASVGLTLNQNPHIRPKIHLCFVPQHLAQPEYE